MPGFGAERTSVQNPLIQYAGNIGWKVVSRQDALARRGGEAGLFFADTLRNQLLKLNPDILTPQLADDFIKKLEDTHPSIEGNQQILAALRGEATVYHQGRKRELNVDVIDFTDPENNVYAVTDEWAYGKSRADVIFLINGIPVVIVEAKNAHKEEGLAEGVDQLRGYHRETPELLLTSQLFDVPNFHDMYYGVTWNLDRKALFNWKDEERTNYEKKVKAFFAIDRILAYLQRYILFVKKDDDLKKYILRQHQVRAIEKVVERALDKTKKTGLIWHTQGSGKTFTMITAAQLLITHPDLNKPTVLMLVDRNELETQLFNNLAAYGFEDVEVAERKTHLRELLATGRRGLTVSMLHKFEGMPANVLTRDDVYVLIDEAHRSTGGDLGTYLQAAIPNATYLGFTGTPIDKTAYGKGTFKVFGKDDQPKGYLDKYSMAESIEDGTTLRLDYSLAPNDMLVNEEVLEKEFLSLAEAQGVSDISELNKILDRAVNLKEQMKADDRVQKIAAFVARHFKEKIEPMGYKAFLVAVDREACAFYKKALDKHLPPEYSQVVYSPNHGDKNKPHLKAHHLTKSEEKKVRKTFAKKAELPKILIVTEKLLTGFDAPILYAMYLDKPMRDHVLLQTIARVNRPYEDNEGLKKPAGFVLDFVGIFEKLERALSFDSDEVKSVIESIDLIKGQFAETMQEKAPEYLRLVKGKSDDKAIEAAIEHFDDKDKRLEFFKWFKTVEAFYEIISPDPFLRPYIEDYNLLARLFATVRLAFKKRVYVDKEFMGKTAELVRGHVSTEGLTKALPVQQIDENTLELLKGSDKVKVINLIKAIRKTVDDEEDENPILVPIGAKAEAIAELYDNRQMDTQEALDKLKDLVKEYNRARAEWRKKGLDAETFGLYWALKQAEIKNAEKLSVEAEKVFKAFPNWNDSDDALRGLKTKLYGLLLKTVGKDRIKDIVNELMNMRRR